VDFAQVLARRRMVRNFEEGGVEREVLERIAQAAQRAPSAGFSQGQRMVVVTDPSRRARVAEIAGEQSYIEIGMDPWISRCAAQFIPLISEEAYHRRYREPDKLDSDGNEIEWPIPYWWMDAGCTVMAILLAAVAAELGAGFVSVSAQEELRTELGIPAEFTAVGVIPVGRPLPDKRSPSLKRGWVPRSDFARWERW